MTEIIKFAEKPKEGEPWDVVIIGSGPASLTAAVYTTRGAASTLIIGGDSWGGQLMLTTTVDNFPGFPEGVQGPDLMKNLRAQAERFGAEFIERNAEAVEFKKDPKEVLSGGKTYLAKSVVIATGAQTKWLGIPGEDKFIGKGVSSCAPCDAPFFKEKNVVVVGGGDSAMEEALVLARYANKVTIIHRREALKASAAMQKKVFDNPKISIVWSSELTEMFGEGKLQKINVKTVANTKQGETLRNKEISEHEGELLEEKDGYIYWTMPIDGVFVAIGHTPATSLFMNKIELTEKGYIRKMIKDGELAQSAFKSATNIPGVFVAGDVEDFTYRQAITAAGFGCMAGMDVLKYIEKQAPLW